MKLNATIPKLWFGKPYQVSNERDEKEEHPDCRPDEFRQMLCPPPARPGIRVIVIVDFVVVVEVVARVQKGFILHRRRRRPRFCRSFTFLI